VSDRDVADIVADLRSTSDWALPVSRSYMDAAADELERLDALRLEAGETATRTQAEIKRLHVEIGRLHRLLADNSLEDEITRALNSIPARHLRDGEPWEDGVRRMREELDELRAFDPQDLVGKERHQRSIVESELERLRGLQ